MPRLMSIIRELDYVDFGNQIVESFYDYLDIEQQLSQDVYGDIADIIRKKLKYTDSYNLNKVNISGFTSAQLKQIDTTSEFIEYLTENFKGFFLQLIIQEEFVEFSEHTYSELYILLQHFFTSYRYFPREDNKKSKIDDIFYHPNVNELIFKENGQEILIISLKELDNY